MISNQPAAAYRKEKKQVIKYGIICCGTCGHRVKRGYTYCNHCGQKQSKEVMPYDYSNK